MRDVAHRERSIRHGCHAALLVELAQAQLVHPYLARCLVRTRVADTYQYTLHVLQRGVTQHGDFVLRLAVLVVIHHVGDGRRHICVSCATRFVARRLGVGEHGEGEVEHVLIGPYFASVCRVLVVAVQPRRS